MVNKAALILSLSLLIFAVPVSAEFDLDAWLNDFFGITGAVVANETLSADLVAGSISAPTTGEVGQQLTFDTLIQNAGNTASGTFSIKWFVNGEQLGYGGHNSVAAGFTDRDGNSQFSWTPQQWGDYEVEFVVDADNHVVESNEGNNHWSTLVIVTDVAETVEETDDAETVEETDVAEAVEEVEYVETDYVASCPDLISTSLSEGPYYETHRMTWGIATYDAAGNPRDYDDVYVRLSRADPVVESVYHVVESDYYDTHSSGRYWKEVNLQYGPGHYELYVSGGPGCSRATQPAVSFTVHAQPEQDTHNCPARIESVLNKNQFAVGDEMVWSVFTYDSAGNPLAVDDLRIDRYFNGEYDDDSISTGLNGHTTYDTVREADIGRYDITLSSPAYCRDVVSVNEVITVSAEQDIPRVPDDSERVNYAYSVEFERGWNLVSKFIFEVDGEDRSTTCRDADFAGAYTYDPIAGEYINLFTNWDAAYPYDNMFVSTELNGMWLKTRRACEVNFDLDLDGAAEEIDEFLAQTALPAGWNMIGILPTMEGKTLREIQGGCSFGTVYLWENGNWVSSQSLSARVSSNDVGRAFLVKVPVECRMASSGSSIPALPR